MKFLYSMVLLMSAMSICSPEKALTTKLRNSYDLQLAQKKKEIESRKLLESVAKKQKKMKICDDQQKNIENKKSFIKRQQEYKQIKAILSQPSLLQRYHAEVACLGSIFMIPVMYVVIQSLTLGTPIGCYEGGDICLCLGM